MKLKYTLVLIALTACVTNLKADKVHTRVGKLEKLGRALVKGESIALKKIKGLEVRINALERQVGDTLRRYKTDVLVVEE